MSVDVFIYFYDRLPCALDEIEDALDQAFSGLGEVTGSGAGENVSNIDLCVQYDSLSEEEIIEKLRQALLSLRLPASSEISIDGKRHLLLGS